MKQILLLSISLLMYCNASSQEVNMNRWIEIILRDGWRADGSRTICFKYSGDSANTKIKIVSGTFESIITIGEYWPTISQEFRFGTDTMRIYGNVKKFTAFANFYVDKVDLDNNTEVTYLNIETGRVNELNITNCTKMHSLYCSGIFSTIDLSRLTELVYLSLGYNSMLTNLNLSNQTKLKYLDICNTTVLTNIHISHLKELEYLNICGSNLASIDIRGLNKLNMIDCYNTKFSTTGYDSIFCALPETDTYSEILVYSEYFPSYYNTIMATNSQNAISKGWTVLQYLVPFVHPEYPFPIGGFFELFPTTGTFDCKSIGIDDVQLDFVEAKVYPNPAIDYLSIETKEVVQRLEVYDALGRKVISKIPNQNNFSIDISNLEQGIYILKLQTKEGIGSYKIVKN
ncbi:MAG: T9SS type A sorting domain-containing protein [Bacteroidales bacterium]|nr:T9SS type A sorting domain-containing protein [Bacteroidales bacterium]